MIYESFELSERAHEWTTNRATTVFYNQLRGLAAQYLRQERSDHTLQPTALVNETYLKLSRSGNHRFKNKAHFVGTVAQMMRKTLVDHARAHGRSKRGGTVFRVSLQGDEAALADPLGALEVTALHDALKTLQKKRPEMASFIELRYFVGLTIDEVAKLRGTSRTTAVTTWRRARAWLRRELSS